ncbi:hypothetical protein M1L60_31695 [Actinoplanes sp. TRM 88003]|uniref:Uncharacterized protein n=1 Tax=Paractinoplanes aksuensis TaxID=2939490 RepID=A0ABT1DWB9_9ACTN|nr:hypothetical protein [Actinoplanes aksuensis]MCO8275154.1 hypothetical protein [Actinoplanes aksuensis]
MTMKRRDVLAATGIGLVGGLVVPAGVGVEAAAAGGRRQGDGWGPVKPAGQELALPDGFSYRTFGRAGSKMSDGLPTPGCHDGQYPGVICVITGRRR